ncbi:MAG: DUF655 domain-containing protein [Methanobrevibacter sp.]|uniref:DUF655 domain-containing protein n=1 Tax=Methanobrevibacter sp. TaxID=66852 RepID=UPI0026DFBD73|nr:DUF655 domain-containing protein [Methanobrevibacter sp.]MDO5848600.1 DUF655 domain-containing protein [Methanobrevibacter sp.]
MNDKNRKHRAPPERREENALILDYLSLGYVKNDMSKFKGKAIAQAIGADYFTLLELTPIDDNEFDIGDTVYIGKDRSKAKARVFSKLDFENLTATSRIELDYAIRDLVLAQEAKFVEFFNTAEPISTRLHKLELIPGIGKKHMWKIIEARKEKPFESFEDISERVPPLSDPVGMIVNRIKQELDTTVTKKGKNKYHLFTNIPRKNFNKNVKK